MQQLPSLATSVIKQYLAIPKVKNLLEFSFLLNNTIDIKPEGWESLHYRGEPRRYQYPCRSSYFRNFTSKDSNREIEEIKTFKETLTGQDIQNRLSNLKLDEDHYYWWFLTQHHSEEGENFRGSHFQTRLLDVSKNPYVALFFSCLTTEKNDIEDGYVYIFYDLSVTQISPYTTYIDYIQDTQDQFKMDRLLSIDWHNLPEAYDVVKRVVAQSGEFLAQKSKDKSFGAWEFIIDGRSKNKILDDLSLRRFFSALELQLGPSI